MHRSFVNQCSALCNVFLHLGFYLNSGIAVRRHSLLLNGWGHAGMTAPPIRLGASSALLAHRQSTNTSSGPLWLQRGYTLCVRWLNTVRGGVRINNTMHPLELLIVDDHSQATEAKKTYEELIASNVNLLLGPYGAELTQAAADVVNASDAIMVAPGAAAVAAFRGRNRSYGILPPADRTLERSIVGISARGASSVATITDNNLDNQENCASVQKIANATGLAFTGSFHFNASASWNELATDFYWLKQQNPKIVVACMTDPQVCGKLLQTMSSYAMQPEALIFTECFSQLDMKKHPLARFSIGAVPWHPSFPIGQPVFPQINTSMFLHRYRDHYNSAAHYLAVAAWSAVTALVAAIERSNSLDPSVISQQLRTTSVNTIFGPLRFDKNGQLDGELWSVQYSSTSLDALPVLGPVNQSLSPLIYPLIPWALRPCFQTQARSIMSRTGLLSLGNCSECPPELKPSWTENVLNNAAGWKCIPRLCKPGEELVNGSCSQCPAGRFSLYEPRCAACIPGQYADARGSTKCTDCLVGKYANESEAHSCMDCPAGYEGVASGASACRLCRVGFHAPFSGSPACSTCQAGKVSVSYGMVTCTSCLPGKYSGWGARQCVDCAVGTYQNEAEKSLCKTCSRGMLCQATGLGSPSNEMNWWSDVQVKNNSTLVQTMYPCPSENTCLMNNTCQRNSAGVLCQVCNIGFTWTSRGCRRCPPMWLNVSVQIFIACTVCICAYSITALSILAASKSKAITSALLKLLMNYITTSSIMVTVLIKELTTQSALRTREGKSSYMAQLWTWVPTSLLSDDPFGWDGVLFSFMCTLEPPVTPEEKAQIDAYVFASTIEALNPKYSVGKELLRSMHWKSQMRSVIFWAVAPVALAVGMITFGLVVVVLHLHMNKTVLTRATEFLRLVDASGYKQAVEESQGESSEIHRFYMALKDYRVLGVWRSCSLASLRGLQFWKQFCVECEPVFVVVFFFSYPYMVKGFLQPLDCSKAVGTSSGNRVSAAMDIPCQDPTDSLFWTAACLMAIVGLGMPILAHWYLYRIRSHLLEHHYRRTWGFLTQGYEIDRSTWECLVLLRKCTGLIIASIFVDPGYRLFFMLLDALFFSSLHVMKKPFDNRFGELLDRVESFHLVQWIVFCVILLAFHISDPLGPQTLIHSFLVVLVVLHAAFILMLLRHMATHIRNNRGDNLIHRAHYAQYVDYVNAHRSKGSKFSSQPPWKTLPSEIAHSEAKHNFVDDVVLRTYAHHMDCLPYMTMDCHRLWISVIGNRGAECVPPVYRDDAGVELRLSSTHHVKGTKASKEDDRQYLVDIILEAIEYIIVNMEYNVFSASLLEFVLRCGFSFTSEGSFRSIRVEPESKQSTAASFHYGLFRLSKPIGLMHAAKAHKGEEKMWSEAVANHMDDFKTAKTVSTEKSLETQSWRRCVDKMFDEDLFLRGVTIQDFQLNITTKLFGTPRDALSLWLDAFEDKWQHHHMNSPVLADMDFGPAGLLTPVHQLVEKGVSAVNGPNATEDGTQDICITKSNGKLDAFHIQSALSKSEKVEVRWLGVVINTLHVVDAAVARRLRLEALVRTQGQLSDLTHSERSIEAELTQVGEEIQRLSHVNQPVMSMGSTTAEHVDITTVSSELTTARNDHQQAVTELAQVYAQNV